MMDLSSFCANGEIKVHQLYDPGWTGKWPVVVARKVNNTPITSDLLRQRVEKLIGRVSLKHPRIFSLDHHIVGLEIWQVSCVSIVVA